MCWSWISSIFAMFFYPQPRLQELPCKDVLHCFLRMKKVGKVLERTKTDIKIRRGSLLAAQAQATVLGTALNGHATQVLIGSETIQVFQTCVPELIGLINT